MDKEYATTEFFLEILGELINENDEINFYKLYLLDNQINVGGKDMPNI